MDDSQQPSNSNSLVDANLSSVVIFLLKGVIYREGDERLWTALFNLQAQVRDYVKVLGLELMLDEAEGYAFLQSRAESEDDETNTAKLPRLIARRPLSFPVSLLLALLRKKLAEFDASGSDTRLILNREQLLELMRIFVADTTNEVRLLEQLDNHINKVVELGFLRRLKTGNEPNSYEVRRILKAFVDAQWLTEFDAQLTFYATQLTALNQGEKDV